MGKYLVILTAMILLGIVAVFGKDFFFPTGTGGLPPEQRAESLAEKNRVAVTRSWKDGIHRYTGTFLLPHSCFTVGQTGVYQDNKITVTFDVADRSATSEPCVNITTRYPFTVLVEAPKDISPIFFLNKEEVPSKIRDLEWQSVSGTLIETSVTSPTFH